MAQQRRLALNDIVRATIGEYGTEGSEQLLAKYVHDLPIAPSKSKTPPLAQGQTILITGTTGSLGSYLLSLLESLDNVAKVVCLNRGPDGGCQKQQLVNTSRGLVTDFKKSEFLHANLAQPYLGLGQDAYDQLLNSVDRIIHNAWSLDTRTNIHSFEPHILGVRRLVDFASRARKKVPIIFISSGSTALLWAGFNPVPETNLEDLRLSVSGYGQSKHVSSLILQRAAEKSDVPSVIIRVGQIAGPLSDNGTWNKHEWLPRTIASSVALGVLPKTLGPLDMIDWIPSETVARAVLEIAGIAVLLPPPDSCCYYNLFNPSRTNWLTLYPAVQEFYAQQGRSLRLVSLADWISQVKKGASTMNNPAADLLYAYEGLLMASNVGHTYPDFAVQKATEASIALRESGAITPDMMKRWCKQWNY